MNRRSACHRLLPALLVAAVALPLGAVAPSSADHIREGDVRFKVTCEFDQAAGIDPIVHPGELAMAHRHDFFGRRAMTADVTTYDQLLAGTTTCNDPADLASYWAPAVLLADGTWAEPSRIAVYYRRGNKHGTIQPFPAGLKIVAGFGDRSTPRERFGWRCASQQGSLPPEDCAGTPMTMFVEFPDCWDGANLDSADHRSHMAYSVHDGTANVCPSTHPVPVPKVTQYVNFPDISGAPEIAGLSSGKVWTVHADFFNGWTVERLAERVETCLNQFQRCASGG